MEGKCCALNNHKTTICVSSWQTETRLILEHRMVENNPLILKTLRPPKTTDDNFPVLQSSSLPATCAVQFSSVAQSCPTLCDSMNRSTPGLPDHQQLPEFTQTHVHRVGDAIQPSHPLSSPSPALNLSQHQGLFRWVSSSHQVAKVLEFQLQHQSFQSTPRIDLL